MKKIIFIVLCLSFVEVVFSQRPDYTKMSTMVRSLAIENFSGNSQTLKIQQNDAWLCAFVEIEDKGDSILSSCGCKALAKFGKIYIACIPLKSISKLSSLSKVKRIEANCSHSTTLDTMAVILKADKVYGSQSLPQAFTGKGVLVGIQDIGFDYTHPTFLDSKKLYCRIVAVWDMLAEDDGLMPVGRTYYGDDIQAATHSTDGNGQTHGTHTLGIAAGNGYNSPFRGVAYESDICLVANATSNNANMIPSDRINLYTYAMDALGFKYIFDYAAERGQSCVVSFSEGSRQDFHGDDRLYYQVLDSLVGPGRILIASAGNEGLVKTYFHKSSNQQNSGSFIQPENGRVMFTVKGNRSFEVCLVCYGDKNDTITISSTLKNDDTIRVQDWDNMKVMAYTYQSAYNDTDVVIDVDIHQANGKILSVELIGQDADVSFYKGYGTLVVNDLNSSLDAGEYSHSISSPASAPAVICVGSTAYRSDIYTYLGKHRVYDMGHNGERSYTSSIGPTFDERIKPDVMAPGTNVVSAYSSFYLEHNPEAWDIVNSDKEHFDFNGRTYAWNYNSGTSMSTPAVAGTIALWLEACPTLTPNDVRVLLDATARRPDISLNYPNNYYGYGEIDAYAGLIYLLGLTEIPNLSHHQVQDVSIYSISGGIELKFKTAPQNNFVVSVYGIDGQIIASRHFSPLSSNYWFEFGNIPHGLYVIQVTTRDKTINGSQLIHY